MKYLLCHETKFTYGWAYDFWADDRSFNDAVHMFLDEMMMFVGIVARQSKATVTFTYGDEVHSWHNGLQLS